MKKAEKSGTIGQMNRLRCTVCEREFSPDDPETAMPFCSARCKRIDAVRWLGEEYGLPIEEEAEADNIERARKHDRESDA